MRKPKPFQLPQAFLNQLKEFTNGFHLVTINDSNEFETFTWTPSKVIEMALLNYIDIQSTTIQEVIRQREIEQQLDAEDAEDDNGDPSI